MLDRDVLERLERVEHELADLRRQLTALQTGGQATVAAPPAPPAPDPVPVVVAPEPPPARIPASPLTRAWHHLERGDGSAALDAAYDALRIARVEGDRAALDELSAFAIAALSAPGTDRERARQLGVRVDLVRGARPASERPAAPAPTSPPAAGRPTAAPPPARPAEPVAAGPGVVERGVAWIGSELTGPRAFAVVGGIVTLLGVVFFFVLAANRGWVGPVARVTLGALASALAVTAGIVMHWRYGRVHAALGAVGAGIAGAYATLAAATILYGYLPPAGAVVVAAAIATVGACLAVAWSSQILAGLALVGAAAAPALVALDDGIDWPGPAFALVVLVAAIAVAAPRRWRWLDATVAAIALAQVVWLVGDAPADDTGALVIAIAASLVLLAASLARQGYGGSGLDGAAASFALASAGIGLLGPITVLASERDAGLVLLGLAVVDLAVALVARRWWPDVAWAIGAAALLLAGVGAALILTGRSLTIVWALEAVVLALLAWRLSTPRFSAAALAYLGAGTINALAFEIGNHWSNNTFDIPDQAAPGLFALSGAALAVGLLLPTSRKDRPSEGIAAALEPVWDGLVRTRTELRAGLAIASAVVAGAATAAVLSDRLLTLLWAGIAVALGIAAYALHERRLQPFALGYLALAAVHALATDAPLTTLALDADDDPLTPIVSLVALAGSAAVLAGLARFEHRGLRVLGPVRGPELSVMALERHAAGVRATLFLVAAIAATWAAGLLAVDVSYEWGQVVATALWATLGASVTAFGAQRRSAALQVAGGAILASAFLKATTFDWERLGDGAATTALLFTSAMVLLAGLAIRWLNPEERAPMEIASVATAATAAVASIVGLERLVGIDARALGVLTLVVTIAVAGAGLLPYLAWRSGRDEPWLRHTANGYWLIALGTLLFAESALVLRDDTATLALWASTAAALALTWKLMAEERAWLAAAALTAVCVVGVLGFVTTPDRLVEASPHPASALWSLAIVIAACWAVALVLPPLARPWRGWAVGCAAALTLYGVSLAVLEIAIRVSGASLTTDFQRGHTALSALWGVGALALYVIGLARDRGELRVVGLGLFGLALAKLFLYDLGTLSSITRAFSFLALGAILLAAGFFAERLVGSSGEPGEETPS